MHAKAAAMSTPARKVRALAACNARRPGFCNLSPFPGVHAQRLMRDFKRLQQDPPQGVNGSPNPDNIMLWNAIIFGPEGTPWDGGTPQRCVAWSGNAVALRFMLVAHA